MISTKNDTVVEWFLRKFQKIFVTFQKSVITGSRRVCLISFKKQERSSGIYGKYTGADRRFAGDQYCGEEPCGKPHED